VSKVSPVAGVITSVGTRRFVAAAVVALALGLWAGAAAGGPTVTATGNDWPRFGWSVQRSSAPTFATGITAANVGSLVRKQVQLDGTVDSSAIYLHDVMVGGAAHDVFFVTTTYGKTEAIDATSGAVLWRFTPPGYASWAGSAQITTETPVADPGRKWIYAASPGGRIYKLSVANGHSAWSVSITLLPSHEKMAASLNYYAGHVIAVTGGYIGDAPPYQGHVAVIDAANGRLLHVWNSLCSNRSGLIVPSSCAASDAAMFGRAGAVIDPANGDILTATGNAPWDGHTNWGDAALRLSPDATTLLGNYTPSNTQELNADDLDVGSTSPVLLSESYIAQGGKDGKIRLLSVARMRGTAPHLGGEVQTVSTPSGGALFTAPAVWHSGSTTWMFVADFGATAAYRFRSGHLAQAWNHPTGGTSPVVAGGLLYVYDPNSGGLNVYVPATGKPITTLACGAGHWNSPIVVDGRIAEPEGNANDHNATSGVLDIWSKP
jgi:hypothetical protein